MTIELSWALTTLAGITTFFIAVIGAIIYAKPLKKRMDSVERNVENIIVNHLPHLRKDIADFYKALYTIKDDIDKQLRDIYILIMEVRDGKSDRYK